MLKLTLCLVLLLLVILIHCFREIIPQKKSGWNPSSAIKRTRGINFFSFLTNLLQRSYIQAHLVSSQNATSGSIAQCGNLHARLRQTQFTIGRIRVRSSCFFLSVFRWKEFNSHPFAVTFHLSFTQFTTCFIFIQLCTIAEFTETSARHSWSLWTMNPNWLVGDSHLQVLHFSFTTLYKIRLCIFFYMLYWKHWIR